MFHSITLAHFAKVCWRPPGPGSILLWMCDRQPPISDCLTNLHRLVEPKISSPWLIVMLPEIDRNSQMWGVP